jgi:hypothetical protein
MERYIGVLKGMVSLMSDIDANLANKCITLEHLNHLPPTERLLEPQKLPGADEVFPQAPDDSLQYKKPLSNRQMDLLRRRFRSFRHEYPVEEQHIIKWKKYHVKWKCSVGSSHSLTNRIHQRDDSYIWWETEGGRRRYGQVVVFCNFWSWEAIAIVRPFHTPTIDHEAQVTYVGGESMAMETIKVSEICGLVGLIKKNLDNRQVTYLVQEL